MPPTLIAENPFALLELPDGRWCVAKPAPDVGTLVAGSFARPSPAATSPDLPAADPVGFYPSRDEAELAIQRAAPSLHDPLARIKTLLR